MEIHPISNHATLPDMPSATNDDHDGRYYTENEVDTMLNDGTVLHNNLGNLGTGSDHSYLAVTPGTAEANKALVVDSNIDITAIRNLTATGTITAEQLTSTDDITMAGLFTNTLAVTDNVGFELNADAYTGASDIALADYKVFIVSADSTASIGGNAITNTVRNRHKLTGSSTTNTVTTQGMANSVSTDGDHDIDAQFGLEENTIGLRNGANAGAITGTRVIEATSLSALEINAIGMLNVATINQLSMNSAGETLNLEIFGTKTSANSSGNTLAAGTLNTNTYGEHVTVVGGAAGTSVGYGVFIASVSGSDTNWAFYNNTGISNCLGLDNGRTFWGTGQDASIYYDGLNFVIDPKVVGTGGVKILGDTFWEGDGAGLPYAGIYAHDSSGTISVDSDNPDTIVTQWSVNTPSNNCTPDQANNKITITVLGVYFVAFSTAISLNGGAAVILEMHAYLDGAEQDCLHAHRSIGTTDVGSMSFSSFVDVTSVPVDLDIRANINSSTGRLLTVEDAQLNVTQVGGT